MKYFLFLIVVCYCLAPLRGQYAIAGHLNLGEEWQPKVYLAAINKLSDYYRTSPDMIVNTAEVAADGSFSLVGDNLPSEARFYRLYLMKKQNTDYDACLYVGGDDHNFAHLVLTNGDRLRITTDPNSIAPFGNYAIAGSRDNQLMRNLARIVYPSFYFYRIKFPTELKFSEDKLHADLKQFADTCRNTLVALAAVNNTDFDEYFDQDRSFYQTFSERLQRELPNSIYTSNYLLKIRYYANESIEQPVWQWFVMVALGGLAVLGWLRVGQLKREQAQAVETVATPAQPTVDLTPKEKEILTLITQGKSNKEIAAELFVEVSTVKTHINKLYAKIGATNRREAQSLAKTRVFGEV